MNDWTNRISNNDIINRILTRIARYVMLITIVRSQSYKDEKLYKSCN